MHESARAFLEGLVDYAGIFPPAELPLEVALRNYARYRSEPESWMLGRFICPADRLSDLHSHHGMLAEPAPPLRIAALAGSGQECTAFLKRLDVDLEHIVAFHRAAAPRTPPGSLSGTASALVEMLEVRIPADLFFTDGAEVGARSGLNGCAPFLHAVQERLRAFGLEALPVFYEGAFTGDWRTTLDEAIRAIAAHRPGRAGAKLRCGGVTAAAFPTPAQVAFYLTSCRRAGASFKATAGLHHPVRSFRDEVETKMHGFLNVFGAALLGYVHALDEETVRRILEDEDPGSFGFTNSHFAWKELQIRSETIREIRRSSVTSFGSCSFEEPCQELRALGILDPA